MTPARSAEQVVERLLDERGRPVTEFFRQHPVLGAAAAAGAGLALASAIGVGEIAVGLAAGYAAYLALRERIAGRESLRAGGGRGAVVREGRREERAR